MNQQKLGNFISKLRKEKGLTQQDLANELNLTDKAISKWERGLSCPDISLLIPLSEILEVSVNELLLGEKLNNNITKSSADKSTKEAIKISINELTRNKKKNKLLKYSLLILIFIIFIIITFQVIRNYNEKLEKEEVNKIILKVKKNLETLHYRVDDPVRSPNYLIDYKNITYVIPKILVYKKDNIYKEVLSYTNYDTFEGIILYYNRTTMADEITVHHYKTIGEKKDKMLSFTCNKNGDYIDKDRGVNSEEHEFYLNHENEIRDRIEQIELMWLKVYEN